MKIAQWLVAFIFILNGARFSLNGYFLGVLLIVLGLILVPPLFSYFNFSFADNQWKRRCFKIGLAVLGFCLGFATEELMLNHVKSEANAIRSTLGNFSDWNSPKDSLYQFLQQSSEYLSLNYEKLEEEDKLLLEEIEMVIGYMPNSRNLFVGSSEEVLTSRQIDSLTSDMELSILSNSPLNRLYNQELVSSIRRGEDFEHEGEYFEYRAILAFNSKEDSVAIDFYSRALGVNGTQLSKPAILRFLESGSQDSRMVDATRRQVFRNYKDDVELLMKLSERYQSIEQLKRASDCLLAAYRIEPKNIDLLKNLGEVYENRQMTKSAIRYYEELFEIDKTDRDVCKSLRELTKYVARWNRYRICCDGSRSNALGRGACSHHGGVCKNMKEPIYGYRYNCY